MSARRSPPRSQQVAADARRRARRASRRRGRRSSARRAGRPRDLVDAHRLRRRRRAAARRPRRGCAAGSPRPPRPAAAARTSGSPSAAILLSIDNRLARRHAVRLKTCCPMKEEHPMHLTETDVPVLVVGAGPAGLAAADRPRPPRRRVAPGGAAARPVQPAARHRRQHPLDGALPLAGASRSDVRAGGVDVEWRLWCARRSPGRRRRRRVAVGSADAASSSAVAEPDRPGLRAAGPPRAGAARSTCARCRPPRSSWAPRSSTLAERPTTASGRRCATRATGASAGRHARYVVAADGAHSAVRRRARHRDARPRPPRRQRHGPVPRAAVGPARRPPLRHLRRHHRRGAEGTFLPAGPRRPLAVRRRSTSPAAEEPADSRARRSPGCIRARRRRARPRSRAIERVGDVPLRRAARRALPRRAACSSSATPRTGSPRAAARG